jgi:hypothetical protein
MKALTMKYFKTILILLVIALSGKEVLAQEVNGDQHLAEAIYQKSGINGYLDFYSSYLQGSFVNATNDLDEYERDLIKDCFNRTLIHDKIKSNYISQLRNSVENDIGNILIKELSNPVFQNIERQRYHILNADEEKVRNYINEINFNDESIALRIMILREIIENTYSTELLIDGAISMARAVALTMNQTRPESDRKPLNSIGRRSNDERETMINISNQMVLMQFLYIYRDISIDQLKEYHAFSTSELGLLYSDIIYKAFVKSLENGIDNYQVELSNLSI